jgi:hypothetical protein
MADLVDDLDSVVGRACHALANAAGRDWDVPAAGLAWSCRATVEHVADDLFAYAGQIATSTPEVDTYLPFDCYADREGEPLCTVHAKRDRGNAGVVQVLLHLYDVAGPLDLRWDPDPDVARRVLERLFPDAPTDGEPWPTLLRVTGRDPSSPLDSWRWDGRVREP